jgi:hypothetical protein
MKTKMTRQRQTELPRFIVGALATAGASVANGATVQITFANNVVSSVTGLDNFTADLTGDTVDDDVQGRTSGGFSAGIFSSPAGSGFGALVGKAYWNITSNGLRARALVRSESGDRSNTMYGPVAGIELTTRSVSAFAFSDTRINGGAVTNGWLDVEARVIAGGEATMQIHRLLFDDESTSAPTWDSDVSAYPEFGAAVPEPSGLTLLALGAGGLLARRRREKAAA